MAASVISCLFQIGSSELGRESGSFFRDYAAREVNVLLWTSLIAITALLLRKVAALLNLWAKGRKIPGPPCPSFHGHSKLISGAGSGENLNEFLFKSHKKYGPIVRLWLGPTQLLVSVKDLTLIKEVLEKAEDKLPLTGRAFRLAFGRSSLFVSSFEKVQHKRESLALQLNGKLLERASGVSLKVVDCVVERMDSIMVKGLLDCRSFSQHMSFSILGATLFGESFLSWSNAITYEELLMMIAKDACFWASYNVPPVWKRGFWRYRRLCTKLKCLTQEIIQQCKQTYNPPGQMNTNFKDATARNAGGTFSPNDMLNDSLLEALNNQLDHREELSGSIMGVMFHGCLTTAGLIGSILTRLVIHPDIQDKIYSEVVAVCNNSKPEATDVQKMPFLFATVYEAARLLPAGPLLQRCSLKHDLKLKTGVTVPAGTIVVVPIQLLQMDDSCWGSDANQFNPYRFLSKRAMDETAPVLNTSFTESGSSFVLNDLHKKSAFLPFGSGTRACVGESFAVLAIATMLAYLLQRFEVRLQPGCENHPKPTMNNCVLELLPSPKIVLVGRNS